MPGLSILPEIVFHMNQEVGGPEPGYTGNVRPSYTGNHISPPTVLRYDFSATVSPCPFGPRSAQIEVGVSERKRSFESLQQSVDRGCLIHLRGTPFPVPFYRTPR